MRSMCVHQYIYTVDEIDGEHIMHLLIWQYIHSKVWCSYRHSYRCCGLWLAIYIAGHPALPVRNSEFRHMSGFDLEARICACTLTASFAGFVCPREQTKKTSLSFVLSSRQWCSWLTGFWGQRGCLWGCCLSRAFWGRGREEASVGHMTWGGRGG